MGKAEKAAEMQKRERPVQEEVFQYVDKAKEQSVFEPAPQIKVQERQVIFLGVSGCMGAGKSSVVSKLQDLYAMPITELTGPMFSHAQRNWESIDKYLATGSEDGTTRGTHGCSSYDWLPNNVDATS